ncbi:MAG: response regulator transcription factor [Candidatus Woesearchaeota archaeon]
MEQAIVDAIMNCLSVHKEGLHISDIAKKIGYNRITVGKYLDILLVQKKVVSRSVGKALVYSLATKPTLLIVDDEQPILSLLAMTFEEYNVITAQHGLEALQQVAKHIPDLIILDVMMPHMNGFEVCHTLKKQVLTQHIPIIMLSAKSEVVDKVKGITLGADDYLTKPFNPLELEARVQALLKKQDQYAYLHPITALPDVAQTQDFIASHKNGYITLTFEHMQDYFDVVGYRQGVEGIQTLLKMIKKRCELSTFIGHMSYDTLFIGQEFKDGVDVLRKEIASIIPYVYPEQVSKALSKDGVSKNMLSIHIAHIKG